MTLNTYIAGALVSVAMTFTDLVTGLPADPGVVTLKTSVNNGGATVSTYTLGVLTGPYTIVKASTGVYSANLDTTGKPGNWWYESIGTGGVQAISAQGFLVTQPPV